MRFILTLLFALIPAVAQAQTGTVKTQSQLNTEIGTTGCSQPTCLYPDNTQGLITPFDVRQGLLDMTATFFAGGGTAPVSGPATSTVGHLAIWNNTAGTLLTDNSNAITGPTSIAAGTIGDGFSGFNYTATISSTQTTTEQSFLLSVTSAGNTSQTQRAARITLAPGTTGNGFTTALSGGNNTLGTGNTVIPAAESVNYVANVGITGGGTATLSPGAPATTGADIGIGGHATGGTTNIGAFGLAQVSVNGGQNFGVVGSAYNAGTGTITEIGGWFSLNQTNVPTGTKAALVADNGASGAAVFLGQNNGSNVFTIDAGGNVVANGAIVSSTIIGGTGTASTLTLESTNNGSPSGDKITLVTGGSTRGTILSGGQIGLGTETNPQSSFVFSQNTTTGLAPNGAIGGYWNIGANGSATGFDVFTFAGQGQNLFLRADGTAASPTAVVSTDIIGVIGFSGYAGSGTTYNNSARILNIATETFSSGHQGGYIEFDAAGNGVSRAQFMRGQAGLIIGTGTSDPGAGNLIAGGTISATGGFISNGNTGLTQTCTVNQAKTLIFTLGILTGGTCNS